MVHLVRSEKGWSYKCRDSLGWSGLVRVASEQVSQDQIENVRSRSGHMSYGQGPYAIRYGYGDDIFYGLVLSGAGAAWPTKK